MIEAFSSAMPTGDSGWKTPGKTRARRLNTSLTCDAVVIGGGMCGLSTAHALQKAGRQTALLEARRIGSGSTGSSAGILSPSTTIDLQNLQDALGPASAGRLFSLIRESIDELGTNFGSVSQWQQGTALYAAARPSHGDEVRREAETLQKHGQAIRLHTKETLKKHWRRISEAVEIPGQSGINPALLTAALTQSFTQIGGQLYEETPALQWKHDGNTFLVDTPGASIRAKDLIVSTGTGFAGLGALASSQKRMLLTVSGDIVITEPSEHVKGLLRETSCIALWDTLHLYHYVRYLADGRMLIGGGERVGAVNSQLLSRDDRAVQALHKWAQTHHAFPIPEVERAWRASLVVPAHGLPALNIRSVAPGHLVSIVPDGLPFSFLLGKAVAAYLTSGRNLLPELQQPIPAGATIASAILSWLPENSRTRQASLHLAVTALRLLDALF